MEHGSDKPTMKKDTDNRKRYALVTGASRGIGRAIAIRLAGMGYCPIINYHTNEEAAHQTLASVRQTGMEGELLAFDVADGPATNSALTSWMETHPDGVIEVVVNNAGIRRDGLMLWMADSDWYDVLRTNLDGFFHVTQPLLKEMLVRKYGRIINIVSLSGIKGLPGQTNYAAAKGGVIAATRALAQEVAKKGVTVNAVAPGFIRTDMTGDLDEATLRKSIPAGRFGEPQEVADLVAFLASENASYITGEVISINGGIY